MGGEMVYILQQRLQAQNISSEKSVKVLIDIFYAMFDQKFVDELFAPQEIYSIPSTRQIFEKIAHSSIMRLNKSSMDKLFDLMIMGFKYQTLGCQVPRQYLHMTLNHIEQMRLTISSIDEVLTGLIDRTVNRIIATYSTLKDSQWLLIKASFMRFYQNKKVKISLFLQNNNQDSKGTLILPNIDTLSYGTEIPGTIRTMPSGGATTNATKAFTIDSGRGCVETGNILNLTSKIGLNMYTKATENVIYVENVPKSIRDCETALKQSFRLLSGPSSAMYSPDKFGGGKSAPTLSAASARKELNLLADLIGVPKGIDHGGSKEQDFSFKINLFPDSTFDSKEVDDNYNSETGYIMIDVDARADAKTFDDYLEQFGMKDDTKGSSSTAMAKRADAAEDDEDDLLALMDSVK